MDSGAADSVYPISRVRKAMILVSAGMRMGLKYIAAGGEKIPNQGEFTLNFWTKEGIKAGLKFQLAAINKTLCSVSHMTDNDYCVVFSKHEGRDVSYVMHKPTEKVVRLRREKGIYILDAWTEEEIGETSTEQKPKNDSSFRRPR